MTFLKNLIIVINIVKTSVCQLETSHFKVAHYNHYLSLDSTIMVSKTIQSLVNMEFRATLKF